MANPWEENYSASAEAGPWNDVYEPPKPVGGFGASAKQALGSLVKGAGQAAEDFLPASIGKDNAVKKYGQSVIDANPTAVQGFSDIADSPWMAAKEATGNAAGSMGSMLGLRALGMGITAASPLTGPFAPATALAGQAVANVGPFVAAALPSFGGIREKQIAKDPNSTASMQDKALAAAGAGTVGLIEGKFGPQAWAMKAMTKEGRAQLAKGLAETTLAKGVGYGALKGAAVEGSEELVQNPIEQLAAYEDPRTPQNIKETLFGGAMGAIGGGVLGGATGAANQMLDRTPPAAPNQAPTDQAPPLQIGHTPDPLLSFPDGTVARRSEIDAYINGLPADQQPAARAKAMGLAPQPGTPEPVVKPSEAMGLDPAAGPLSAAAVTAVDTGAHQEIQLQQANEADQAAYEQATAEPEQKVSAPKPTPAAHEYSPYADANGDIVSMDQQPFRTFREALIQRQFENKAAGRNDFEAIKTGENQFVVRRVRYPEKQSNGPSTEVQSGDTGSTGVRSTDSPASVGVGATDGNGVGAQPRRSPDAVLDQAGQLPKRVDAAPVASGRAQPTTLGTQTTATAGPGFTAKDVTRVQNAPPGTNTTPAAPAVEAPAVVAGDAATSEGLPNAGSATVEGAGVDQTTSGTGQASQDKTPQGATQQAQVNPPSQAAPLKTVESARSQGTVRQSSGQSSSVDGTPSNRESQSDDQKRAKAIERIAKGSAYFSNGLKAQQFIAQNGLKDTHQAVKTSATRWDVKSKASQPQEQPSEKAPKAIEATAQQQAAGPATNPTQPAASDGVAAAPEAGKPAEPVAQEDSHFEAAKALLDAQRKSTGNVIAEARVRKQVRDLAEKVPEGSKAALVLDTAATRLGMGEGKLKGLEFAPAVTAPPIEQPAPEEAPSSRPGEPSAEQIKSVKDITLTKKVGDSVVKKTSNASNAMKAINERADALEMVRKCLA